MAADVLPLAQLKLPVGPSPFTAEQRYWKSFKNQKSHTSTASWPINHISFPAISDLSPTTPAANRQNDLFAVTSGPRVAIYSIRKRELLKAIGRFDSPARGGEIRSDGRVLVAGEDSGKMQVFDVSGGSRAPIIKTWHHHKQPVWVTRWSPNQLTTLMSTSDDNTVNLWDLTGSAPTRSFYGHQGYIRAGEFMTGHGASSNMLVTGSYDKTVRVWDARTPQGSVLTFKHAHEIYAVRPLPSGTTVLASSENVISVLDLVAAKPLQMITNHQKTVTSLCLASQGRRVVSGGLDGHVKIFETGSWNVVASSKYPAPVLAVSVISAGANAEDRHLAVGMSTGVLSIKTRLTGPAAEREQARARELAAQDAGLLDQFDAAKARKKRKLDLQKRLDKAGEANEAVIANARHKKKEEAAWQRDLRLRRFSQALDTVLDETSRHYSPLNVLTLLVALRHRSALRDALQDRDEVTVQPMLRWICAHIVDPRYVHVCVDVGFHLLDLYAEYAAGSTDLDNGFRLLRKRVLREVERAQMACQTNGMVESLMMGAS